MRWAADEAQGPRAAGREAGRGALGPASTSSSSFSSPTSPSSSLDGVWSLLAELYERPLEGDIQRALADPAASSSSSLPPVGAAAV